MQFLMFFVAYSMLAEMFAVQKICILYLSIQIAEWLPLQFPLN